MQILLQDHEMFVNCIHKPHHLRAAGPDTTRVDSFTFINLNESGILPGWICSVRGCYRNEVPGPDDYVLTPMQNCTLEGEL